MLCPDDKLAHAADKCLTGRNIQPRGKIFRYIQDSSKWCRPKLKAPQLLIVLNRKIPFPTTSRELVERTNETLHKKNDEQVMTDRPIACLSYLILGRITRLPTEGVCKVSIISALSVNDMKYQCGLSGLGNKLYVQVTTGSTDTCLMSLELWLKSKLLGFVQNLIMACLDLI